eukprot:13203974-Alexandrium_andersonii.AAC.1
MGTQWVLDTDSTRIPQVHSEDGYELSRNSIGSPQGLNRDIHAHNEEHIGTEQGLNRGKGEGIGTRKSL